MNIINEDRVFELELNGSVMNIRGKIVRLIDRIKDEDIYEVVFKDRNNAKMKMKHSYIMAISHGVL